MTMSQKNIKALGLTGLGIFLICCFIIFEHSFFRQYKILIHKIFCSDYVYTSYWYSREEKEKRTLLGSVFNIILSNEKELQAIKREFDKKICRHEWNSAVDCLVKHYKHKTFVEAHEAMEKEGPAWLIKRHHGFGTGVRNVLRMGGFRWRSDVLDGTWIMLFKEATKEYFKQWGGETASSREHRT